MDSTFAPLAQLLARAMRACANMNRREQIVQILARGKSCAEILIEKFI
jgi:DNA-binding CsgD family transcriptional regulator